MDPVRLSLDPCWLIAQPIHHVTWKGPQIEGSSTCSMSEIGVCQIDADSSAIDRTDLFRTDTNNDYRLERLGLGL
jgi:hypothetical protein